MYDWASQVALVIKDPPVNAGDIRDTGRIPGLGRPPEVGHGHPLQYSCLKNPVDRGTWWTTIYKVAKNQTGLKELSMYAHGILHKGPEDQRIFISTGLG